MAQICDFFAPELERNVCPRTGALTVRYSPTWVGVRDYQGPNGLVRALHHPDQVTAQGFVDTLKRLIATPGHPEGWVHVRAGVLPRDVQVGHGGDTIEMRPCREYPEISVPTVQVTVTDAEIIDGILGGTCSQSSLGYEAMVIAEPGVWLAPDGSEHPYDVIHVLDPTDPRATPATGANHLALLPAGRGGVQSAVLFDATLAHMPDEIKVPAEAGEVQALKDELATLRKQLADAGEEALKDELTQLRKKLADAELENANMAAEMAAMTPDAEAGAAMRLEAARALAAAHGVETAAEDPAGVVAEVLMAVAPDALQGMSPGDPGYDTAIRAGEAVLLALQPAAAEPATEEMQDAAPKRKLVDDTAGDVPVDKYDDSAHYGGLFGGK